MCPSVLKKKTVKEVSADVDTLEKRFEAYEKSSKRLEEEQNERIKVLENKLELSEKIVKHLEEVIQIKNKENKLDSFDCKVCKSKFKQKRELKKHIGTEHPKTLICQYCDESFDQSWKLETHLKTHEQAKSFKCDSCDKSFVLKWRLRTHKKIHENTKTQYCHFFNNELPCPYEEIGCMFRHVEAPNCRYQTCCTRTLCPFKHKNVENYSDESVVSEYDEKTRNDEESDDEEEIDFEKYDVAENVADLDLHPFRCQKCTKTFENQIKLIEHVEGQHVQKEKVRRDILYPEKCRHCEKCITTRRDMEFHYLDIYTCVNSLSE